MKIGTVFEQTSTTEFWVMLDQQRDNERLLFSYIELSTSPDGAAPTANGERIIGRIINVHKENPLLSRDQAGVSASLEIADLGFNFSRRFTYGWAHCTVIGTLGPTGGLDMNRRVVAPNAGIYTPSPQTLRQLFFNSSPNYIPIGAIETISDNGEAEVPVTLNADQLVTKHFCIFGMTGSGKTNTSAKLLEELMARGHRMIIFDSHDDYKEYNVWGSDYKGWIFSYAKKEALSKIIRSGKLHTCNRIACKSLTIEQIEKMTEQELRFMLVRNFVTERVLKPIHENND